MKPFPPNVDPQLFAISAVAVGTALIDHFTVNEQNAIANWLMLVGQYIEVVAAQQQLIQGRIAQQSNPQTTQANTASPNASANASKTDKTSDEIEMLTEMMKEMQRQIDLLREQLISQTKKQD